MSRKKKAEIEDCLKSLLLSFVASDYRDATTAEQDAAEQIAEKVGFGVRDILPVICGRVSDRWFEDTPESDWPN